MRQSTREAWPALCEQYEGAVPFMYQDTKGLVTFGFGNMIDAGSSPSAYGKRQPWTVGEGGPRATPAQVEADYDRVNAANSLRSHGGWAYKRVAQLRLSREAMVAAMIDTTERFWTTLAEDMPRVEQWPADAQLALLNLAWNVGPNLFKRGWPNLTKAAHADDMLGMADACLRAVKSARDYRNRLGFLRAAFLVATDNQDAAPTTPLGVSSKTVDQQIAAAGTTARFACYATQVMLQRVGTYEARLDGLFGPVSLAGLRKWAKRMGLYGRPTRVVLTALSADTLKVDVT